MRCKSCGKIVDFLTDGGDCLYCDERRLFSPTQSGKTNTNDGPEDIDPLDPIGEEGRHID